MARDLVSSGRAVTRQRALITKIGLDGHDVGVKVVAHTLRNAGFEVIYLGIRQTPSSIVATAIAEDVDVIGVSILSGAHSALIADLMRLLREREVSIPVVIGGLIPATDHAQLRELGVSAIVNAGTQRDEIVRVMRAAISSEPR